MRKAVARRRLPCPPSPGPQLAAGNHETATCGPRSRPSPTKQRQAVAYHHVAGLPYAEVAALVGGSTDAARRAAHDGIRALRRRYLNSPTVPPQKES